MPLKKGRLSIRNKDSSDDCYAAEKFVSLCCAIVTQSRGGMAVR